MKQLLTILLITLIQYNLLGQTEFSVEDRIVKTGSITKVYTFHYQIREDSIYSFFADSTIIFTNPEETIVKKISGRGKYTRIQYLRTNKEDSISKHFVEDKLSMIYETKYDSLGRRIYYAMKNFMPTHAYDWGFKSTYEYHDSLTGTRRFTIQTVFDYDESDNKHFHSRVTSEYDNKNRKIKETSDRPMSQSFRYFYDKNGHLIKTIRDDKVVFYHNRKIKKTKCRIETKRDFPDLNFSDYHSLVRQLVLENKKILTTEKCENFSHKYVSPNKQMTIIVNNSRRHHERRNVSIIVTKSY